MLLIAILLMPSEAKKPKYEERKVYIDAETPEFAACALKAATAQSECRNDQDATATKCRNSENWKRVGCEAQADAAYRQCQNAGNAYCVRTTCRVADCTPDYSSCTTLYDFGFTSCGGQIRVDKVCVKNCP